MKGVSKPQHRQACAPSRGAILEATLLENASLKLQLSELQKIALRLLRQCRTEHTAHSRHRHGAGFRSSSLPATNTRDDLSTIDVVRLARCFADDAADCCTITGASQTSASGRLPHHLPIQTMSSISPAFPATPRMVPVFQSGAPLVTKSVPTTPTMQSSADDVIQWDNLDNLDGLDMMTTQSSY